MGGSGSRDKAPPEGLIVSIMTENYGESSERHLSVRTEACGFPKVGSLSMTKLRELEETLKKVEEKERQKKAIQTSVLKEIESHKSCLKLWKKEAENRNRKQLQSQMTKFKVEEWKEEEKTNTLPSSQSLYPFLTGCYDPPKCENIFL